MFVGKRKITLHESLTVTSEINNTGSPDLLGTQSHKTFKNIQKSKHSRITLPSGTQLHYSLFLQSYASKESNSYIVLAWE